MEERYRAAAIKLAGVFEHLQGSAVVLEVREIADGPGAPVEGLTWVASDQTEGSLEHLCALLRREAENRGYRWVHAA